MVWNGFRDFDAEKTYHLVRGKQLLNQVLTKFLIMTKVDKHSI